MRNRRKRSSLSAIWGKLDSLVSAYAMKEITYSEYKDRLKRINEDANNSDVPLLISENFVAPYIQNQNTKSVSVHFESHDKCEPSDCGIIALEEDECGRLSINLEGVHRLYSTILSSRDSNLPEDSDFEEFRMLSFHRELGKLPGPYFMFLAVLCKLCLWQQIFTAEKRGGRKIAPTELSMASYQPLLWALKQFENFYKRIQNRDMRSDFGIIWHEGEWIERNKTQETRR